MCQVKGRLCRKDRRIYDFSDCLYCGSCYGVVTGSPKACATTTCMACGAIQCMSNGLARGQCAVCYIGLLPGWSGSDRPCSYKGCKEKAIACADGQNKNRCRSHLEQGKWAGYIEKKIAESQTSWVWVDGADVPIKGQKLSA